jgi:hypothetical protein
MSGARRASSGDGPCYSLPWARDRVGASAVSSASASAVCRTVQNSPWRLASDSWWIRVVQREDDRQAGGSPGGEQVRLPGLGVGVVAPAGRPAPVFQHVDADLQVHEQQPGLGPETPDHLPILAWATDGSHGLARAGGGGLSRSGGPSP